MGAIAAGLLLVQFAFSSGSINEDEVVNQQLALSGSRTTDGAASRGGPRSGPDVPIDAALPEGFLAPADEPDPTTTTTSTTTSTTIPPTTTSTTARPTTTSTTRPTTTTAARRAQAVPSRSAPQTAGGKINTGDVWQSLAECESGNNNVNTGNGYHGFFQFSRQTWQAMGGSGVASDNGPEKQLELARKLQSRSGWGQWPSCSRKLGLR